jgi:hypothetical protein
VRVSDSEGVAKHPPPCHSSGHREVSGEKLARERVGQPLGRRERAAFPRQVTWSLGFSARTDGGGAVQVGLDGCDAGAEARLGPTEVSAIFNSRTRQSDRCQRHQ